MTDNKIGPNCRRLIAERMGQLQVERVQRSNLSPGPFGLATAVAAGLMNREAVLADGRAAAEWVKNAIAAVRNAPGGAIYTDNEQVAAEILDALDKKKAGRG